MKKFIIIVPLIMLVAGCTVIDERYRVRGVQVDPVDYYEYTPSYDAYYTPFFGFSPYWIGLGWWNPFWHYGFYDYYFGYYYPSYYGYYGYWRYPDRSIRYGKSRITKDQLSQPRTGGTATRVTRTRITGETGTSSGTVSRTRIKKSGTSSGTVSRTRTGSSSSGTKVKKKK
ncbi:MAG: hypothetical protein R6V02_09815 [Candidatus Aminicenantes bacterium]